MTAPTDIVLSQDMHPVAYAEPGAATDVGSLAAVLRRRWKTMLLVTVIVGAPACLAIWYYVEPLYEVIARIHVAPVVRPIIERDVDTDISMQYREYVATECSVITSPAVILDTIKSPSVQALPGIAGASDPLRFVAKSMKAERVPGTQLIEISMTGKRGEDNVVILNTLIRSYLRRRENDRREWDTTVLRSLRANEAEMKARLEAKDVELRHLAIEDGTAAIDGQSAGDARTTELQRLLTEAEKDSALAAARLEALGSEDAEQTASQVDDATFDEYLRDDVLWQNMNEQLRSFELEVLTVEHLGRGPDHPAVRSWSDRRNVLQNAVARHVAELQQRHRALTRRRLEATKLEAGITARVMKEEIERLKDEQSGLARQAFLLNDLRHERERLEETLAQVRQKIWSVEVEQNRMARVTIDSLAMAPESPNIDKRLKYSVVALCMTLLLACGVSLIRDRADRRVRDASEVTDRLRVPLLGSVQNMAGLAILPRDERMLEPMRGISVALLASPRADGTHSRLITSPTARSGKSSVATNLAQSLASTGRRVLLVDADNTGQGVTRAFDMVGRPGLKEMLEGTSSPERSTYTNGVENLEIVPAGQGVEHFAEILARQCAQKTLRFLFASYDAVIVDSPPVLASSDAVILATMVDEVIMVLRAGKSTRDEAAAAQYQLAAVGSRLVGVILNGVDPRRAGASYSYAHSGRRGATDR